ncbi:MAG: hypothetical protein ACLSAH_18060 [Bilophila wadsworthia]
MGRSGTGVFAVTCTRSSFVRQQYAFACPALFPGAGLAVKFGDRRDMALFDLLVGSINVCNTPEHGNPRFHAAIMVCGYTALEALKEPTCSNRRHPISAFTISIEGNYEQAMNLFSRASRKLRAQEHHLVEMFYVRHWALRLPAVGILSWRPGCCSRGCACSPRAATTSSPVPYAGSLRRCICAWGNMKRRWNSWT